MIDCAIDMTLFNTEQLASKKSVNWNWKTSDYWIASFFESFSIKAVSACSHVRPACYLKWTWWGGIGNIQSTHSPNSMKTVMDKLCSSSCAIIWFYSFQYTFITCSSKSFSSKINDFLCRFWSLPSMVGKGNDNKHFNSFVSNSLIPIQPGLSEDKSLN